MNNIKESMYSESYDLMKFAKNEIIENKTVLNGSWFYSISGNFIKFEDLLHIKNCKFFAEVLFFSCNFSKIQIYNCEFRKGLKFDCCLFLGDFEIIESKFDKKLSFYDCSFQKKIKLKNLVLNEGTDIAEHSDKPYSNNFIFDPIIE